MQDGVCLLIEYMYILNTEDREGLKNNRTELSITVGAKVHQDSYVVEQVTFKWTIQAVAEFSFHALSIRNEFQFQLVSLERTDNKCSSFLIFIQRLFLACATETKISTCLNIHIYSLTE